MYTLLQFDTTLKLLAIIFVGNCSIQILLYQLTLYLVYRWKIRTIKFYTANFTLSLSAEKIYTDENDLKLPQQIVRTTGDYTQRI